MFRQKGALKDLAKFTGETPAPESFLIKIQTSARPQPCLRPQHSYFLVNEGVHLTLPPHIFSVQVISGACTSRVSRGEFRIKIKTKKPNPNPNP